jgi:hypothetical protein
VTRCSRCGLVEDRASSRFCRGCGATLGGVPQTVPDAEGSLLIPPKQPPPPAAPRVARTVSDEVAPPPRAAAPRPAAAPLPPPAPLRLPPGSYRALARLLARRPRSRVRTLVGFVVRYAVATALSVLGWSAIPALLDLVRDDLARAGVEAATFGALTLLGSALVSFLVFRITSPRRTR